MMALKNGEPALSDADLESLLRRGRMSDPRRERIIEKVLASGVGSRSQSLRQDERPRLRRVWGRAAAFAGAVAAAVVLIAVVRTTRPRTAEWRAREGHGGGSLAVEIGCSGGTLDRCPAGSSLIFRTQIAAPVGFVVAYADPLSRGGERVWYFSAEKAPEIRASDAPALIGRGIRLGPEHSTGAYEMHVLVLRRRVAQEELGAVDPADVIAREKLRFVVVP